MQSALDSRPLSKPAQNRDDTYPRLCGCCTHQWFRQHRSKSSSLVPRNCRMRPCLEFPRISGVAETRRVLTLTIRRRDGARKDKRPPKQVLVVEAVQDRAAKEGEARPAPQKACSRQGGSSTKGKDSWVEIISMQSHSTQPEVSLYGIRLSLPNIPDRLSSKWPVLHLLEN